MSGYKTQYKTLVEKKNHWKEKKESILFKIELFSSPVNVVSFCEGKSKLTMLCKC